jgi:hypothetical protein
MTFPSHICFSAALLFLPVLAQAGDVAGSISLADSNSSNAKAHDLAGVVVWLEPLDTITPPLTPRHARMLQKDKHFEPHVLAISVGSTVAFPNLDPIFHNAFSNFSGQIFDIGLYPPGSSRSIRFERPGIVRVFCNIHSTMSALIAVLDTPYFATTSHEGAFSIASVPPGRYQMHLFHERTLPKVLDSLARVIAVRDSTLNMDEIEISEAGYLPTLHNNKYGRPYPAEPDEQPSYSVPLQ